MQEIKKEKKVYGIDPYKIRKFIQHRDALKAQRELFVKKHDEVIDQLNKREITMTEQLQERLTILKTQIHSCDKRLKMFDIFLEFKHSKNLRKFAKMFLEHQKHKHKIYFYKIFYLLEII